MNIAEEGFQKVWMMLVHICLMAPSCMNAATGGKIIAKIILRSANTTLVGSEPEDYLHYKILDT